MNNSIGSVWRKIDLHIHTPASYDWDKSCTVTADDFINKFQAEHLALVAITDHNTVAGIEDIVKKAKGKNVTILPGVELTTDKGNKGIHIIGVFGTETSSKEIYDKVLCPLGLSESDIKAKGSENVYCNFEKACELIHDSNGLVVLHAGRKANGIEQLDSDLRASLKKDLAFLVDIFEVTTQKQVDDYRKIVFPKIKNEFPCIITSDSCDRSKLKFNKGHSIEIVGEKYSWIKSEATFSGLKQIIYEPYLRVCLDENPPVYLYPQIVKLLIEVLPRHIDKSIKIKDRFCLGKTVEFIFNPNLNSVVGGRATGKSTFLELIGFVFNKHTISDNPKKPSIIDNLKNKYPDVNLKLQFKYGEKEYQVTKKLSDDQINLYGFDVIYLPQDEIEKRAASDEMITDLINNLIDENKLRESRSTLVRKQLELEKLRNTYSQIFLKQNELKNAQDELKKVQLVLNFAQSDKYKTLAENLSSKINERERINSVLSNVEWQISILDRSKEELAQGISENYDILKEFIKKDGKSVNQLATSKKIDVLIQELTTIIDEVKKSPQYKKIIDDISKLQKEYLDACKKLGLDTINQHKVKEALENKSKIEIKIKQLEQEIKFIENAKEQHSSLLKLYKESFKEYKELERNLINLAKQKFGKDLEIELSENAEKLLDSITERFIYYQKKSGKIGLKETDVNSIISGLSLEEITKYLKKNEIPGNVEKEGRGHDHKITAQFFFIDEKFIYREVLIMNIEELLAETNFVVRFKNKKLHEMSFGERCGVVLRLILSNSNLPLIIDQPEDHLDNKYIVEELLGLIRSKKLERQIILSTHNPNIVVNGDSEIVEVLSLDSKIGYSVNEAGALENHVIRNSITIILEGGEEAFLKREKKYDFAKT